MERYLAHLDSLGGGIEPAFNRIDGEQSGDGGIAVIRYDDLPDLGVSTALTYGLSLAEHPEWRFGKPKVSSA